MARCPSCANTFVEGGRTRSTRTGLGGEDRTVVQYRCARCGLRETKAADEEEFLGWDERWNPPDAEKPDKA